MRPQARRNARPFRQPLQWCMSLSLHPAHDKRASAVYWRRQHVSPGPRPERSDRAAGPAGAGPRGGRQHAGRQRHALCKPSAGPRGAAAPSAPAVQRETRARCGGAAAASAACAAQRRRRRRASGSLPPRGCHQPTRAQCRRGAACHLVQCPTPAGTYACKHPCSRLGRLQSASEEMCALPPCSLPADAAPPTLPCSKLTQCAFPCYARAGGGASAIAHQREVGAGLSRLCSLCPLHCGRFALTHPRPPGSGLRLPSSCMRDGSPSGLSAASADRCALRRCPLVPHTLQARGAAAAGAPHRESQYRQLSGGGGAVCPAPAGAWRLLCGRVQRASRPPPTQ